MGFSIACAAASAANAVVNVAKRLFAFLIPIALLSSPALGAPSTKPAVFEPESKWTVDFDDQRCFAARRFRSASQGLVFGIASWRKFDWAKVVIEKPGRVDGILPLYGKVSVDGGKAYEVTMVAAASANDGRVIYTFSLTGEAIDALKAGKRARVQAAQLDADIPMTSLSPVLAKLDECLPLLLEHWGFGKDKQAVMASFPAHATRTPQLRSGDYPAAAVRRGAVGVVEVLVNVGTEGKALDCRIIRSSGHKDLDDTTCQKLLSRGKFLPGRDRSGKAVVSPFYFAVNWLMPTR
ncbi:MAG TPA: TonB family protein [Sphingomicrobium sp.]|nr:TonB family protein [Sphingomicrobium sp.]